MDVNVPDIFVSFTISSTLFLTAVAVHKGDFFGIFDAVFIFGRVRDSRVENPKHDSTI